MRNRKRVFVVIAVALLVFAVLPTAVAQELSSNSVIFGGGARASGIAGLVQGHEGFDTLPYLSGESYSSSPVFLDSRHVADVVDTGRGVIIMDPGSIGTTLRVPMLYLAPIDVDAETRGTVWRDFREGLSEEPRNSLVILQGFNDPEVISDLSADALQEQWNRLLEDYPTVRAVGLPETVYVKPVADDAMDKRQGVFSRHEGVVRNFQESTTQDATDVIRAIDSIFREISESSVANEITDALDVVWRTKIREELSTDREGTETGWVGARGFIDTLIEALTGDGVSDRECLVTVSTTPSNGAQIYYYKSLLRGREEFFSGSLWQRS